MLEQIPAAQLLRDIHNPPPRDEVSRLCDGSPIAGLLWREVRRLPRKAGLTQWESVVFLLFCRGISDADIGRVFVDSETGKPRTRQAVRKARVAALSKIDELKHLGCLTVMIQQCGWSAVREYLADIAGQPDQAI